MSVVSVQIEHKSGRRETIMADGNGPPASNIQHAAPSSAMPAHTPRAHGGGALVIFVDPDIFESDAEPLARWLTAAGLGSFAVGPWTQTQWPAQMTPDLVAVRSMLNRVRLLQVACTGSVGAVGAMVDMLGRPPTEPPPQTARAASLARRKATAKAAKQAKGAR